MPRTTEAARKGPKAAKSKSDKSKSDESKSDTPKSKSAAKSAAKSPSQSVSKAAAVKSGPRKSAGKPTAANTVAEPVFENAGGELATAILSWLDEAKAEEILALDIRGKTSIGDCMIIASGRSDRHVGAIAHQLRDHLKDYGVGNVRVEGIETCDWVLVDVGAIVVNLFRPDVRTYYNLEKMWSAERPDGEANTDLSGDADATH